MEFIFLRQINLFKNYNKLFKILPVIIGVGGLGTHVAEYLVRSGVQYIILIDPKKIDPSDIGRQILYSYEDIGKYKVDISKNKLKKINPNLKIRTYKSFFNEHILEDILLWSKNMGVSKIVLFECTDSINSKIYNENLAYTYEIPLIYGSVENFVLYAGISYKKNILQKIYHKKKDKIVKEVFISTVSICASVQVYLFFEYFINENTEIANKGFYFNLRNFHCTYFSV